MKQVEFCGNRKRGLEYLLLSIICAGLAAALLLTPASRFVFALITGGICAIGGAGALVYGLFVFVIPQKTLVIDSRGISLRPRKGHLVEWRRIASLDGSKKHMGRTYILVQVDDPYYFIENEKDKMFQMVMRNNHGQFGAPFVLWTGTYNKKHDEILALLEQGLSQGKG